MRIAQPGRPCATRSRCLRASRQSAGYTVLSVPIDICARATRDWIYGSFVCRCSRASGRSSGAELRRLSAAYSCVLPVPSEEGCLLVRWAARYLAARSLRLSQPRTAPPRSRCSRSAYAAASAAARAAPAPLCQRRHSSYARLWAAGARPTVRRIRRRQNAMLMAATVSGAAIPRLQQKATASAVTC